MSHDDPQWRRLGGTDAIAALSVLVSLLLFSYTRKDDRDPESILDLGLAYMVFTAFGLGLMFHWAAVPVNQSISPAISWIGAVVLMFAAIVPSTPIKTMLAGVVAVSMNPIAMWIARARGTWNFESPTDALLMHYPDYLLLRVAVVISHVVTGSGTTGRQSAGDGKLSTRRAAGSWRNGGGLPRDPPLPQDLEQLVLSCLAKKPENRPRSAAELDRRLAAADVEPWTDVHAQQWWATTQVSGGDVDGNVETHPGRHASGASDTRLAVDREARSG